MVACAYVGDPPLSSVNSVVSVAVVVPAPVPHPPYCGTVCVVPNNLPVVMARPVFTSSVAMPTWSRKSCLNPGPSFRLGPDLLRRFYFHAGSSHVETYPGERLRLPVSIKILPNSIAGERIVCCIERHLCSEFRCPE